jgi:hypothetical protein
MQSWYVPTLKIVNYKLEPVLGSGFLSWSALEWKVEFWTASQKTLPNQNTEKNRETQEWPIINK